MTQWTQRWKEAVDLPAITDIYLLSCCQRPQLSRPLLVALQSPDLAIEPVTLCFLCTQDTVHFSEVFRYACLLMESVCPTYLALCPCC